MQKRAPGRTVSSGAPRAPVERMGSPGGSVVKNLPAVQEARFKRSPGGGRGSPLQYCCLENPHGQRSLAVCSPRGREESDMAERLDTCVDIITPSQMGKLRPRRYKQPAQVCLAFKGPIQDWHLVCLTSGSSVLAADVLIANLYDVST